MSRTVARTGVTIVMLEQNLRLARQITGKGRASQWGGTLLDNAKIRHTSLAGAAV